MRLYLRLVKMIIWTEHVKPYEELLKEVASRFEKANRTFKSQLGYAPIETLKTRIKSEASAKEKLERKGLSFDKKGLAKITDIVGIRVICKFIDDVPEIMGLIKSWEKPKFRNALDKFVVDQVEVVEEQDHIDNPKESGYRSYHVVCRAKDLFFEVQIRTIAMDFWASTEHMLKYKYGGDLPQEIREKLKSIADIGSTLDLAMNDIRQDVKIGTTKSRLLEQFDKAVGILEKSGLSFKAENYKARLAAAADDLEALKSLAIQAKEDVPPGLWRE
ncbi:hypothetical protein JW711_05180 [Candidatus Woesearchaeota archaeon]|nr:hypothetical protein [Candidatus Woesearchaeota archaeon]